MKDDKFQWAKKDLAHPGKRYQGQFIDLLISIAIFSACLYIVKPLNLSGSIEDILILVFPFGYFILSDALPNGQSLGKKLLGIKVVSKKTGKPCTILQSIVRNIFTPILGVIDAALILGSNRQRLGDVFANTIVIKISK